MLLIPIAFLAFYRGKKLHHGNRPICIGGIGIICLVSAVAVKFQFEIEGETLETIFTTIGSILLISAHIYNITFLKSIHL